MTVVSERPEARVTPRIIGWWLMICALLVLIMVAKGGWTRLTDSGLSMVEWQPLTLLPPLSDQAWHDEFEKYRAFPEYQKINRGMSLDDFKAIYWPEYIHRLWGRVIGLAFAIPFAFFLWRRMVDRALACKLAGLFVLGGMQGLMGWVMVQSGLVDRPDVSQYRLVAHLGLAALIYALMIKLALSILAPVGAGVVHPLRAVARALVAGVALVMAAGGFVAGLDAGLIYNTFPTMNGAWVPQGLMMMEPWWRNLFENVTTVQFNHRVLAIALTIAVLAFAAVGWSRLSAGAARSWVLAFAAAVLVQAGLGIATLLAHVPVSLGVLHQVWAFVLLSVGIATTHHLGQVPRAAIAHQTAPAMGEQHEPNPS